MVPLLLSENRSALPIRLEVIPLICRLIIVNMWVRFIAIVPNTFMMRPKDLRIEYQF